METLTHPLRLTRRPLIAARAAIATLQGDLWPHGVAHRTTRDGLTLAQPGGEGKVGTGTLVGQTIDAEDAPCLRGLSHQEAQRLSAVQHDVKDGHLDLT